MKKIWGQDVELNMFSPRIILHALGRYLTFWARVQAGHLDAIIDQKINAKRIPTTQLDDHKGKTTLQLAQKNPSARPVAMTDAMSTHYSEVKEGLGKTGEYFEEFLQKNDSKSLLARCYLQTSDAIKTHQDFLDFVEHKMQHGALFHDRNSAWQKLLNKKIDNLQKIKKVAMVVGLAHLVGQDGMIEYLKGKGYNVKLV
ncbi:MAG: TraB/GumN family protein [Alphaproteobacteria bacterium]